MKEFITVTTIPVITVKNDNLLQQNSENIELLKKATREGYVVTHITSCAINGIMYVYHWLERETK